MSLIFFPSLIFRGNIYLMPWHQNDLLMSTFQEGNKNYDSLTFLITLMRIILNSHIGTVFFIRSIL